MEFAVNPKGKYINSIIFREETGCDLYYRDEQLYVSGCETQEQADALFAAHNPSKPPEPTVADKLASVGLSLDDLKAALGL